MGTISNLSVSLTANTKGLERGFRKAQRKVNNFTKSILNIKTAVAGALGIGGIGAMVGDLVAVNSEMQRLQSGLKTVTGSADDAAIAFNKIKQFSVSTPFELNEVVDAFVKLKAYGLEPSERALTAYGNTASAMGKSLNQMVEAVADAATGEFERLKEFGIRASKQGEQVTFTFKGVSQTVKMESEAIQGYLMGISETHFASAMGDQMRNLGPAFSNFRTAIQDLKIAIGEAGLNQAITDLTNNTTAWLNSLDRDAVTQWTQDAIGGVADFLDKAQSVVNYIAQNSFLQYGGIIGYALFGKLGVGVVALIDRVNTNMAKDVAGIWERLNPSDITGGGGAAPGAGTYQLGAFNEGRMGALKYIDQMNKMNEATGKEQIRKQEEANGVLHDIADTLRNSQRQAAIAG